MSKPVCATPGCGKPSELKCPTCTKLSLPPSFFCSQDCFRQSWNTHKNVHNQSLFNTVASSDSNSGNDERFAGYSFTGPLRPGKKTPKRTVPPEIPRPDYADDPQGEPKSERELRGNTSIHVHTPKEIEAMRKVCRLCRDTLDYAASLVAPGVTTDEIDAKVHDFIISKNAYPSPLNYRGFPKSICTSVNEVICHGIPDDRPLQKGDIINVDVSVYFEGFHGDINETYFVGGAESCSETARKLVQTTYESLDLAIQAVHPRFLYREVGGIITKHVGRNNFSVVRAYCGHGVGRLFHTAPNIPHYAKNKAIGVMQPGHIFSIEPMINEGVWKETLWPDDWTAATIDGKLSAQFEHTILVTETGFEVLTARTENSYKYPWLKDEEEKKKEAGEAAPTEEKKVEGGSGTTTTTAAPAHNASGNTGGGNKRKKNRKK
eukprot:TRINITY_DN2291_c0_g1_i1.p1 TRINITY_DN2291_c0_g1~~TRINITY_DN2291_c0_g1_i1.p1  ORF type:complete len:433 (+),score=110.86 TRINITY_DN2291_c0_g1_i1:63-1361(+)